MSAFKRAAVATAAAVGLTAGAITGTSQAQAATPGDLQLLGGVQCFFGEWGQPWNEAWYMKRWLTVKNVGGTTMRDVTLHELNGRSVFIKEIKPGQTAMVYNKKAKRWENPIETRWSACLPSSISGYVISGTAENLTNNIGFWWNLKRKEKDDPATSQEKQQGKAEEKKDESGGGNNVPQAAAARAALADATR